MNHGDLGPWNIVQRRGRVTGVIDWDLARFGHPLDDLTQLALEAVPLKPSTADRLGLLPGRRRLVSRLRTLCAAYGGVTERRLLLHTTDFLERMAGEVEERGAARQEPFHSFVETGFAGAYRAEARHIAAFFLS